MNESEHASAATMAAGTPSIPSPLGTRRTWPHALAVLILVLAVFFSPALLGPGQFLFRDTGRMHHPVKSFIAEELRQGRFPQWNPYMGLGVPLPGTAVDAVQHPFNLLLAAFPFEWGFKAWVLLSYLLGGTGAFAWARRMGLSFSPALACSLLFALSGFLVSSSDNLTYLTAAASIPWMLTALEAWLTGGGPLRLAGVIGASWLCAAAGDPQAWGFALGIMTVRGLALGAQPALRRLSLRRTGIAALGAAAGAAPVLLPILLWAPHSRRVVSGLESISRGRWDLHPLRILEFVFPGLFEFGEGQMTGGVFSAFAGSDVTNLPWVASIYVGITCVALAVFAARRSRTACLFLVAGLALTWAAAGHHLGFLQLAEHVPVLRSLRYWEKLTVWPTLFFALAAGVGLERLLEAGPPARRFGIAAGSVSFLLLVTWCAFRLFPEVALGAVARPGVAPADAAQLVANAQRAVGLTGVLLLVLSLASLALAVGVLTRAAPVAFVAILALDVGGANLRAYLLAPPETVRTRPILTDWLRAQGELPRVLTPYELTDRRWQELSELESTWRWGAATYAPAWHVAARVGNFDSYTGLSPSRLGDFRLAARSDRVVPQVGLWGVGYVVVPSAPANAVKVGLRPPLDVAAGDAGLPAFLVRFPHRPRAYLAVEVERTDPAGALAFALDPGSVTSARTLVEAPVPDGLAASPPGSAALASETTDELVIDVDAKRPALLVLNDQDAPGWRAEVDGQARPIVRANYLARGVWMAAGRHRVTFRYRAPGLVEGWCILGLGVAGILAWHLLRRRAATGSAST